jgi:CBS domain-containing protein
MTNDDPKSPSDQNSTQSANGVAVPAVSHSPNSPTNFSSAPVRSDASINVTSSDGLVVTGSVIIVSQEMPMQEAVQMMIDKGVSSILVHDASEHVTGILTERDIVRKFTLLEMADKLTRTVATVMTRPVMFSRLEHLRSDITKLHLKHKIRHFPVISGTVPHMNNIVGIVSITDLARNLLTSPAAVQKSDAKHTPMAKMVIGVLASQKPLVQMYIKIFKGMAFAPHEVTDVHKFLSTPDAEKQALLFDLDGFSDLKLHDLIPVVVKSKSFLIMTTSNPQLVTIFKKYMNKERQEIAMKPIDLSYLSWMISSKWAAKSHAESEEEEEQEEEEEEEEQED